MKHFLLAVGVLFASLSVGSTTIQAQQAFNIDLNFTGDTSFQPIFDNAVEIWESILPSYIDGQGIVGTTAENPDFSVGDDLTTVFIDASVAPDDGPGNTLAFAAPTDFVSDGNFILASRGIISFDSDDIGVLVSEGTLEAVVLHEIGHILGFGTLWTANGVYDPATSSATSVGQYVGANGLAQYNAEFGLDEDFVPIENNGGPGTADSHFDEEFFGVALDNDPTVATGLRLGPNSNELLTGFLSPDVFISNTNGGTFQDIGFNVDFSAIAEFNGVAVPEPGSALVLFPLASFLLGRRRKR